MEVFTYFNITICSFEYSQHFVPYLIILFKKLLAFIFLGFTSCSMESTIPWGSRVLCLFYEFEISAHAHQCQKKAIANFSQTHTHRAQ